jgi:hypothetical protein
MSFHVEGREIVEIVALGERDHRLGDIRQIGPLVADAARARIRN